MRWRARIGEAGCKWLLAHSIAAAIQAGVIQSSRLETVVLDTTVQPKAIAHPTDSRLLNRAREQLVGAAQVDSLLGRNRLKGSNGDALHAILCCAGHNLRMGLAHLRVLYAALITALVAAAMFNASRSPAQSFAGNE